MSDSNNSGSSGGIGFIGLLTILFIGLKLSSNIDWSWPWVLSPLWLPVASVFVIYAVCVIIGSVASIIRGK